MAEKTLTVTALLSPKGVPPADASETHKFTFTTEVDPTDYDREQLERQAIDESVGQGVIPTEYAAKNHWEVADISIKTPPKPPKKMVDVPSHRMGGQFNPTL